MMAALALGLSLASSTPQDTLLAARRGDVLTLETHVGSLVVRVWDRSEVRLDGGGVLRRQGSQIRYDERRSGRRRDEFTVTIPEWLDLTVEGRELDIDVDGVGGRTRLRTLDGDVRVRRASGETSVRTVSGEIDALDVSGRTELWAADGDVTVTGARGSLAVRSTSGDLTLVGVDASEVAVETTDGDVDFTGRLEAGARVRLSTHDGDVTATIPPGSDVDVSVSTFDGSFEPSMPVVTRGLRAGEALDFRLGRGGATLSMQAFDGDIRLRHGGGP